MRRLFLTTAATIAASMGLIAAAHAPANAQGRPQIILFQEDNFRGQQLVVDDRAENLQQLRFNDRASSVRVVSGTWLLCSDAEFRGGCITVRADVPKLDRMGFDDRISSVRLVGNDRRDDRRNDRRDDRRRN